MSRSGRITLAMTIMVLSAFAAIAPRSAAAAPSSWLEVDGNIAFDSASGASFDWGNSGATSPTTSCPSASDVSTSGAGGLFNCGSPDAGSAPPTAPPLTTAAAADASIRSTAFVADAISSDDTTCGSGDPTTFVGGQKNGDKISGIGYTTGSNPSKSDLGNVYAITHVKGNGHPEIFFGAERLVNNGDSHVDFEFLQSVTTAPTACAGTFAGDRTEGDLLIAVDFTGGGAIPGFTIYEWHCNADPGTQPANGTVCDPTGTTPPHYEPITAPAAVTVQVNSAEIPCGGWVCRDKITGNAVQVAANDFMEGGIDLDALNFTGCINTYVPHTRAAQPFTASLADFAGPIPLATCVNPPVANAGAGASTSSVAWGLGLLAAGLTLLGGMRRRRRR